MMKLITAEPSDFDRTAAEIVAEQIRHKPDSVLGFATGSTTVQFHRELAALHVREGLDFSLISSFNLDEYRGISAADPESCRYRMEEQLFAKINITRNRIYFLDGLAEDMDQECSEYERQIERLGGIDLQVLGIGTNGHIAFNEPGTPFHTDTRVVDIAKQTIQDKSLLFGSESNVPRQGVTMGIRSIMHAKSILLLAKGAAKAGIIHQTLYGPVTEQVPASILQLHPQLTVVLDKEAASELPLHASSIGEKG